MVGQMPFDRNLHPCATDNARTVGRDDQFSVQLQIELILWRHARGSRSQEGPCSQCMP